MAKQQEVKVKLITGQAQKLNSADAVLITVDPQFYDMADAIRHAVMHLVRHDRVEVIPMPAGSMKVYSIEFEKVVMQMAPQLNLKGKKK